MEFSDLRPGDVVKHKSGKLDYLIGLPGNEHLLVNACNPTWIDRGLRYFGQECYKFTRDDFESCEVVDHFGNGSLSDADQWYQINKDNY